MAAAGAYVRMLTLLEPKSPQHGRSESAEEVPAVSPGATEEQALHRFTALVLRTYSIDEPAITGSTVSTHGRSVQLFRSLHPISESSGLHCPGEILQAPALDENDAEVIGAMGWEENDIRDMFQPIMTALQVKIRHRLGVGRLDLSARHLQSDNNNASDVTFTYKSKIFSFGDFKTSLAVNAKIFTQFPLGSTEPPLRLSASIVALFNQMAGYAKIIRKKSGDNSTLPEKEIVTLLTAFPSYIFIVVFRFPAGVTEPTIHVSRNLIKFTPPSGMEAKDVFLNIFNHSHVFNYVKHMFWAQYIVTYHHVKNGVEHRYATEEQYRGQNEGLILGLREAQSVLGEVHTYPFTIKLIHSIDAGIKKVWHMVLLLLHLLHHLPWQSALTSQMRISRAPRVELLGHHTLTMDYASSTSMKPRWRLMEYPTRRFWPLILSEGAHWQSSWEHDKQFFLYRHCNLFIKIYGPRDKNEFDAELRLYTDCKALQGQAIPHCYGSGHVEGSEDRFIIISYEGEPLQEWNSETRIKAEKLLRQLHQAGFHHHDIKPDNVVTDRKGRLKLIDFGLSSRCDELSCDIVD